MAHSIGISGRWNGEEQTANSLTILPLTEVISSTIHADYSEDFEFDEQVFRPAACIACSNYHRIEYGGNLLVSGIYPCWIGW
ncbi:MAG: hypothetical protein V7K47_09820 [Nostoc sp.]